jgi:hypothetical protein
MEETPAAASRRWGPNSEAEYTDLSEGEKKMRSDENEP